MAKLTVFGVKNDLFWGQKWPFFRAIFGVYWTKWAKNRGSIMFSMIFGSKMAAKGPKMAANDKKGPFKGTFSADSAKKGPILQGGRN